MIEIFEFFLFEILVLLYFCCIHFILIPSNMTDLIMSETSRKKPRTSEDFYLFCKFILEYENYEEDGETKEDKAVSQMENNEASSNSSSLDEPRNPVGLITDEEDSFDLVTCFCKKPFAGRPMIECSKCLTWIHLRCAKVKKTEIPEVFICSVCQDNDFN